jgi:galactose-1-phosphate uridylyltransferase
MSDSTHPVSLQLTCKTTKDIMELLQQVQTVISNGRITQKNYNLFLVDIQTSREALQTIWSLIFAKISANKLNDLTSIELLGSFIIKFYDQSGSNVITITL